MSIRHYYGETSLDNVCSEPLNIGTFVKIYF